MGELRLDQTEGGDTPNSSSTSAPHPPLDSTAFHSQLESFSQHPQNAPQYAQHPFDMGSLSGALPPSVQSPMNAAQQYGTHDGQMMPQPSMYPMQHVNAYSAGRGVPMDPMAMARAQQQYYGQHYGSLPHQSPMTQRPPMQMQPHGQYAHFDPYGYGLAPMPDPRLLPQGQYGMPANMSQQFARRSSEPSLVPSFPRGPPRKPKQSGHALWVGNLPPQATVIDLKDHFSRDATKDIESLFLISKSNCAFVNYRSEAACVAAMNRFHDSRFHGVRLVCRLRRGSTASMASATSSALDTSETASSTESPAGPATPTVVEEPANPTIVGSSQPATQTSPAAADGEEKTTSSAEKYFVVKSLTVQDLEASVRNGIWATQSHNETVLNDAYENASNVYLIFSANKSGEYFGYARMASAISGEPVNLSTTFAQPESHSPGAPQSIPTPATKTAPPGRIIDDSARGTIFWEAEQSDVAEDEATEKDAGEGSSGQNWGRQFSIEWISTSRLPFYRTRGLRNPWNANREVKIARDGTELETSVGRRLVQMFHRPSPGPQAAQNPAQYR